MTAAGLNRPVLDHEVPGSKTGLSLGREAVMVICPLTNGASRNKNPVTLIIHDVPVCDGAQPNPGIVSVSCDRPSTAFSTFNAVLGFAMCLH